MSSSFSPTIGNLCRISFPLMLTALSSNLMFVLDRLILARYSLESMNAVTTASLNIAIFQFAGVAIASIAEVFVGRYNGAQQYDKIAQPVWQMIWFAIGTFIIFLPLSIWGGYFMMPISLQNEGLDYFKIVMFFSPLISIIAALAAFFIGMGQVKLVTYSALVANLSNFFLDFLLIFGLKNFLNPMGAKGAAIATILAQLIQMAILAKVFLNKHYRKNYSTHHYYFKKDMLYSCLKVGFPSAISHVIEVSAWSVLFHIMAGIHLDCVTIHTIGNSILILFAFVTEGLQKGVMAIASNLIGSNKTTSISQLIRSSFSLHIIFIILFAFPLVFYSDFIIYYFLVGCGCSDPLFIEGRKVLKWVWIYFIFDNIVWILAGLLTSGGDTRFIMVMNAVGAWLFAILPVYIGVHYYGVSASTAWGLTAFYSFANMVAFFLRFRSGKWQHEIFTEKAFSK